MPWDDVVRECNRIFNTSTQGYQQLLYDCIISSPPGAVIEIGSYLGFSSLAMCIGCRDSGKTFYSIDPYPVELEGKAWGYRVGVCSIAKEGYRRNILENFPESHQINKDLGECIDELPDQFSVVFIDGLHDGVNVKNDFELTFPRLISGGWMVIDDSTWTANQTGGDGVNINTVVREKMVSSSFSEFKHTTRDLIAGKKI